jgi:Stage II sporulation protein M
MAGSDLALVQGMAHTRATLVRWNAAPWPVLRSWLACAGAIAVGLLVAVWVIGTVATPDVAELPFGDTAVPAPHLRDVGPIVRRNLLVLALHGFACVAGFIAGSSLPEQAAHHSGLWRRVHEHAGPLAIAFVVAATGFSLVTQALVLGSGAATLAAQGGTSVGLLLLGLLPHAVPELVALFLPLAAWIVASRRGEWHELLAATAVTVGLALPVLVLAAFVEVYVSPHLIHALRG